MKFKLGSATAGADDVARGESAGDRPDAPNPPGQPPPVELASILPYVAPIFAYVSLGGLEGYLPHVDKQPSTWYPIAYTIKLLVVAALAWWYRSTWKDLRPMPGPGALFLAVATGCVVFGLWIGLDGLYPSLPFLMGNRASFDPSHLAIGPRWAFIAVRMLGLVLLIPVIEELFCRSFLLRWVIDQDFERVPIGRVTPVAAAVSSVFFALSHPEWLPALLTGLLWAWLLYQTKSLSACVVSHAVANLALGIYVIASGNWKYW
jgi:CAAX prenyl protease-like protein